MTHLERASRDPSGGVLIVDDHPVVRRGLAVMLRASGFTIVGEAASGLEAVHSARELQPALVVMDLGLPELHGIPAIERILAERPETRVVVMSMYDDHETVARALTAGALAYVVKDAPPVEIVAALRAAEMGASFIGSSVRKPTGDGQLPGPFRGGNTSDLGPLLTPREQEIAQLLAHGLSNRSIAARLGIADKTVANYVSAVLLKLQVADRYAAGRRVREQGWDAVRADRTMTGSAQSAPTQLS